MTEAGSLPRRVEQSYHKPSGTVSMPTTVLRPLRKFLQISHTDMGFPNRDSDPDDTMFGAWTIVPLTRSHQSQSGTIR